MKSQEWKLPHKFKYRDRWLEGPWDLEPDKMQWQDEATGLPCLIVRGPTGALCGYVGVPPGHSAHGKDPFGDDGFNLEEAHGGLTFAGGCQENPEGICHKVEPGEPDDVWWLGFDCAHAWDYQPGQGDWQDECRHPRYDQTYRNVGYVKKCIEGMAAELRMIDACTASPRPLCLPANRLNGE